MYVLMCVCLDVESGVNLSNKQERVVNLEMEWRRLAADSGKAGDFCRDVPEWLEAGSSGEVGLGMLGGACIAKYCGCNGQGRLLGISLLPHLLFPPCTYNTKWFLSVREVLA